MTAVKSGYSGLEQMPAIVRIDDRQVERLLQGIARNSMCASREMRNDDATWKELVRQAACHCVNELYETPALPLDHYRIEQTLVRWWSNRHYRFHSSEHYLQIRANVISSLRKLMLTNPLDRRAIIRFQQFTIYVDELDMELTQHIDLIINAGESSNNGFIVQKLVVEEEPGPLELYRHMTTVFCMSAFGRLPVEIQTNSLLSGKRTIYRPSNATLKHSLDYMRLIKSLLASRHSSEVVLPGDGFAH